MNLNQLHYFVTLAHIEHYTRAAEMLSITQPSLSHAISMLEQELETNLFEKRGRNVVLTKYGKVFLEYVEEALKILDSGVKKTRALTSDTGGVDRSRIYFYAWKCICSTACRRFFEGTRRLGCEFPFFCRKYDRDYTGVERGEV